MKFWPKNEVQNLRQEKSEKWMKSSVSKTINLVFYRKNRDELVKYRENSVFGKISGL